jgi:hypothetical protein
MTAAGGHGLPSRKERIARVALGIPAGHPELITPKPGRAEWKLLATWCAELWPNDEYTSIVAGEWRQDRPQGTQDGR